MKLDNPNQRVFLWDNLKVPLMVSVVITHSIIPFQFEHKQWVGYFWIFIMTYTMPMFMLISGYWSKRRPLPDIVKRYLYPCVLFSLVNNLVGGGNPLYVNHVGSEVLKIGYTMWYLWALFLYNAIIPRLEGLIGFKKSLIVSIIIVFILNFFPIGNKYLQLARVVNFLPFFMLGIFVRRMDKYRHYIYTIKKLWFLFFFTLCLGIYILAEYMSPGIVYDTGLTFTPQNHPSLWCKRFFTYFINVALCISLLAVAPRRRLWYTAYASRTMNVYMLHMILIFPVCWSLLLPLTEVWYGLSVYISTAILISALLFSSIVTVPMRYILLNR